MANNQRRALCPIILLLGVALLMAWQGSISSPVASSKTAVILSHRDNYNQVRERYLRMVEYAVTGSLYDELGACTANGTRCTPHTAVPFDPALRERGNDWPLVGHTMVGHKRLHNIKELLTDILENNIPGDFIELGVWRGGLCIYAKAMIDTYLPPQQRSVYVFDAFEVIPGYKDASKYLAVAQATVQHNFEKYGLLDNRVVFVKGMFKDTVPPFRAAHPDVKLSLLRIDSNYYDSYQDCFYHFYEILQVGGYVVLDDVRSHEGAKAAWLDFKADQGIPDELIPIDDHSAYFKKTKDIKVDMSKKKPPRDANKP